MIDWPRFVDLVGKHRRFLLISHVRPDSDALGSELAMAGILDHLGKDVWIVNAFAVPPNLLFLDPQKTIKQLGADISAGQLDDREVLMVLDTSAWVQMGAMAERLSPEPRGQGGHRSPCQPGQPGGPVVQRPGSRGDRYAGAGGGRRPGRALDGGDRPAAVCRHRHRHRLVPLRLDRGLDVPRRARLLEAGARPDLLYKQLYEQESLARLQLIGHTLARARTERDGRLIYTWVERADFEATGALPSDTEDLINMMLTVRGSEVAVIFVETPSGFKVSFRSRCELDCSRIAEQFGGGGHRRAAGAQIKEPLALGREKVLETVRAAMERGI